MMKNIIRDDIKVKKILRDNGIKVTRYAQRRGKILRTVGGIGVDVTQVYGTVVIALNGLYDKSEIERILNENGFNGKYFIYE